MNEYIENVIKTVETRDSAKPEYIQCVKEVFRSLEKVIEAHPEYVEDDLLTRMVEPDRLITFRIAWVDDNGKTKVNRGYRVQFNSSIGPYKGGLRFHPSVNSSIMYFLGFEQTFKNSLTGLPMGGAKGGSDFDPRGKSKGEIMRFCQAFMTELYRHIGPNIDVPAGDIGVGATEIGFLFGQYKRITDAFENGVITGKGLSYGGSLVRPEATGFGAVYYLLEVLKHEKDNIKGKKVAVSGFGNVAWGAIKKLNELGAVPLTISGPGGYVYDKDGICTDEKINYLLEMRASGRDRVSDYSDKFPSSVFIPGKKPWEIKEAEIIMPCATQNEVDLSDAKMIVKNGVKYYIEVSNMPTTADALDFLLEQKNMIVAPSKAVNAGGVCVSGLEMSQNSQRLSWSSEEVDEKLHKSMIDIHNHSVNAAKKYGLGYNLVAGANIAGFEKVAEAMMAQGIY
ncbi:MAG: NADP-specific glutamate dehydrogenase [Clostridiales bacterium]|nr:NADP-specific glutamate dehydrogenase [Clostridiales bacterium]